MDTGHKVDAYSNIAPLLSISIQEFILIICYYRVLSYPLNPQHDRCAHSSWPLSCIIVTGSPAQPPTSPQSASCLPPQSTGSKRCRSTKYFTQKYGAATDQARASSRSHFVPRRANYLCQDPGQRDLRGDTLYNWDPGLGVAS